MSFTTFKKLFISSDQVEDPISVSRIINSLQSNIENSIKSILIKTQNDSIVLQNVQLSTGANVINTMLGRKLQGWYIVRQRGLAQVYDTQDQNLSPQLTLFLTSSADVSIDLILF